jgi:apolipoprotein N-acyltransferase
MASHPGIVTGPLAPELQPGDTQAVPRPAVRSILLPALASGFLLWLCYFPADWGWLAWLALVPLLVLVRSPARASRIYLCAWAGGLAFYLPALQWMRVADPRMAITWLLLAQYCSLYFPVTVFLLRLLDRRTRLPLTITTPVVWTALEYFRSTFGTGFSWYLLAHSQHDYLPLIQVADLTGAYGVSFLIAAANGLLFEALYSRGWFRSRWSGETLPRSSRMGLLRQGMLVLALLLGTVAYGTWRLQQDTQTPGPRLALIQGSLDQRIRNATESSAEAAQRMVRHFDELALGAAAFHPDLVVWSETSTLFDWVERPAGRPTNQTQSNALACAMQQRVPQLLGLNSLIPGPNGQLRRHNSALLIDEQGRGLGRYDKIHCVPFGEYVPFRDWLPIMNRLAPYDFDYSVWPGQSSTRFPLRVPDQRFTFGVLICYEDSDPALARPYAGGDDQPPADFIVNISNDGWFDGTSEHDQHLAICRFRAVESRRSVARSVNMGISALIDSNGRVLAPEPHAPPAIWATFVGERADDQPDPRVWEVPWRPGGAEELPVSRWGEYKKVPGVLLAAVPIDRRVSFYGRWGDWLPWACWGLLAGVLVLAVFWPAPEKTSPAGQTL